MNSDQAVTPAARSGSHARRPTIAFLGTSLTAGFGLESSEEAFPGIVQSYLDSASLGYRVVNAGVSGDTSAGGLARLEWVLEGNPEVLVVELGANDGLRGQPTEVLAANLDSIVTRARRDLSHRTILLVGMEAPPNFGAVYTTAFRAVFTDVAARHDLPLVPFLLQGVAGVPGLNQEDGIHPTVEGHMLAARNVWPFLEAELRRRCSEDKAC